MERIGIGLGFLTGILAAVGYFSLYRGLELGPMAIVSPITAADGVVGAILAVLFLRNGLSFWQTVMMLVVFVGIVCASLDPTEVQRFVKAGGATSLSKEASGGVYWPCSHLASCFLVSDFSPRLGAGICPFSTYEQWQH